MNLPLARIMSALALLLCSLPLRAQIAIPNTTAVTQNFDSMGSALTLPTNWRLFPSSSSPTWAGAGTAVTQQASTGSPTQGGTYNFGSNASERSVGAMSSGSFASPSNVLAYYRNTSSNPLNSVSVSYSAERYRINSSNASVQFYYSTNGTAWTAVTAGDVATSSFPGGSSAYTFTPPLVISVSAFTVTFPSPIAANGDFYLRWNINTTGSNSQGIAIDNVSVTGAFAAAAASVSSINVVDGTHVDITFSGAMGTGVTTAANYALSGTGKGTLATNPTSVALQSGNTYRLTWGSGEMKIGGNITIAASSMFNSGGVALAAPTSATDTGAGVGTAPTINSTTRNVGSNNPTNAASVVFDATFSEAVTGVISSNFSLSATTSGASIASINGGPSVWTVTVNTGSGQGTIALNLANATGLTDLAGNALSNAPFSGAQSFSVDKIAPSVALSSTASNPTGISPIPFRATFSEDVTGFVQTDLDVTSGTLDSFTPVNGSTYDFTVIPLGAGTTVSVDLEAAVASDAVGNANQAAATITRDYEPSQPQVSAAFVDQTTHTITISFDKPMGAGVTTPANYVLSGMTPGSVSPNPSSVTLVSGSTYLLTWTPGQFASDAVTLTISNVQDTEGNLIDPSHQTVTGMVPVVLSEFEID